MINATPSQKVWQAVSIILGIFAFFLLSFMIGSASLLHIERGTNKIPEFIKPIIKKISSAPLEAKVASIEIYYAFKNYPEKLIKKRPSLDQPERTHKFPEASDDGYLLLAGLRPEENQSIVQLIRISDGRIIAKWVPDWKYIHKQITSHRWAPEKDDRNYLAIHPLLLPDGSIVFNTTNSLMRLALCSSKPAWIINYPHHHSIELSANNTLWSPSVTENFDIDSEQYRKELRDDSLSEIDLDGKQIQNISFSRILNQNGLTAHLLGTIGFSNNSDPIHLNQITPAKNSSNYWQQGDLLISARHLSSVYIYRPSTGKIIWYQQGPWLNQHSVKFFKDRFITVFGNDVYRGDFILPEKYNQVYLHDLSSGKTSLIHQEAIKALQPTTATEGRATLLDDMSLFVEETNNSRIFKINPQGKLQWSFINEYNSTNLGSISWSSRQ